MAFETATPTWTERLRRFAVKPQFVERCELCSLELPEEHAHLMEPATRKLWCACESCAVLFGYQDNPRFRRVPRRIEVLTNLGFTKSVLSGLGIPITLVFFYRSSVVGKLVAMYPSPGGATESLLDISDWSELAGESAILGKFEDDVEALLVNCVEGAHKVYRVPIDECYKLVGIIRTHWKGFSGGADVWTQLGHFFDRLGERAIKQT